MQHPPAHDVEHAHAAAHTHGSVKARARDHGVAAPGVYRHPPGRQTNRDSAQEGATPCVEQTHTTGFVRDEGAPAALVYGHGMGEQAHQHRADDAPAARVEHADTAAIVVDDH